MKIFRSVGYMCMQAQIKLAIISCVRVTDMLRGNAAPITLLLTMTQLV